MRTARHSTRCSRSSTWICATGVARMRDDASLQRLVEMGFAVYAPRAFRSANGAASMTPSVATATGSREARAGSRARVVLLARPGTAAARTLLDGIRRALAFAGLDGFV